LLQKHDPSKLEKNHEDIDSADLIHMTLVDAAKREGRANLAFLDYDEDESEMFFKHHQVLKGIEFSLDKLQEEIKQELEFD
jgi:hypothetical protein